MRRLCPVSVGPGMSPRPSTLGLFHQSDGENSSFISTFKGLRVQNTRFEASLKGYKREGTHLAPTPQDTPICPPYRQGTSFSAARLHVNTQDKLQGKHTADKNLMLYVTKQNEYLIRAFMRNHITKQPLAAAPPGARAWQRSS